MKAQMNADSEQVLACEPQTKVKQAPTLSLDARNPKPLHLRPEF